MRRRMHGRGANREVGPRAADPAQGVGQRVGARWRAGQVHVVTRSDRLAYQVVWVGGDEWQAHDGAPRAATDVWLPKANERETARPSAAGRLAPVTWSWSHSGSGLVRLMVGAMTPCWSIRAVAATLM